MALPWNVIIPMAFMLFKSMGIFGGEDKREEEDIRKSEWERMLRKLTPTQYVDPNFAKTLMQALMNRMGRSANWGWPAGKGLDLSFLNMPGLFGQGQTEEVKRIRP